MRRRRSLELQDDIKETIKSEVRGILGLLIKAIIGRLATALFNMLKDKWTVEELKEDELGL